jgi:hypothetical protein
MTIDANHLRLGTGLSVDGTDLIKTPTKGARVRRSTTQSIPNAIQTALSFDEELSDDAGMYDGGQPTRLTAPADGWYSLNAAMYFGANANGHRYMWFRLNGTDTLEAANNQAGSSEVNLNVSGQVYLSAGDYIEVIAYQNSGTALNSSSYSNSPLFSMVQL